MKNKIFFMAFFVLLISIITFIGCSKDKTTGHLFVVPKLPATTDVYNHSGAGCCSGLDETLTNDDIVVKIYTDLGALLKEVSGANNSTFDCGELVPGNYTVEARGKYTWVHPTQGPQTDYEKAEQTIQIVANKDETITVSF